eukprot:4570986-Prymnesium_polylepis.1
MAREDADDPLPHAGMFLSRNAFGFACSCSTLRTWFGRPSTRTVPWRVRHVREDITPPVRCGPHPRRCERSVQ